MSLESDSIFEEHWTLYRKVIDHDYMDHRAISDGYCEVIPGPLGDVVDLGCGDAEISRQLVRKFGCSTFTGVDSTQRAMDEAAGRTEFAGVDCRFFQSDLLDFLKTRESASFDHIIAGFSVHHLAPGAKREFFSEARRNLRVGGRILFYDVICLAGKRVEESMAQYLSWIRETWTAMTGREHDMIDEHIRASDHPEESETLISLAREAGLREPETIANCAGGFHLALIFK